MLSTYNEQRASNTTKARPYTKKTVNGGHLEDIHHTPQPANESAVLFKCSTHPPTLMTGRDGSGWEPTAYRTHPLGEIAQHGAQMIGHEVTIAGFALLAGWTVDLVYAGLERDPITTMTQATAETLGPIAQIGGGLLALLLLIHTWQLWLAPRLKTPE